MKAIYGGSYKMRMLIMSRLEMSFLKPLVFTLVIGGFLVIFGAATAYANCRESLQFDELYACEFKVEIDGDTVTVPGTLTFSEFDGNAFLVTRQSPGNPDSTGFCTCKADGDVEDPEFDESDEFSCLTVFRASRAVLPDIEPVPTEAVADVMEGDADEDEIEEGQIWFINTITPDNEEFTRAVFECELDGDDDD